MSGLSARKSVLGIVSERRVSIPFSVDSLARNLVLILHIAEEPYS